MSGFSYIITTDHQELNTNSEQHSANLVSCLQVRVKLLEDEPHHLHISLQATGMKDSLSSLYHIHESVYDS